MSASSDLAFCTACIRGGEAEPCRYTREELKNDVTLLNNSKCKECGHKIGSHPDQQTVSRIAEAQAVPRVQAAALAHDGFRSGKRSKSNSPNGDRSSSSGSSGSVRKRIKLDEVLNQQIQNVEALIKAIDAADTSTLHDPAVMHELPFPSIGTVPEGRFSVETVNSATYFKFMGRTTISQVFDTVEEKSTMKKINIYGTKGYGKSHIIAAVVLNLMKDKSKRILFLPQARDLSDAPAPYLKRAMLLAFARDEDMLSEIDSYDEVAELVRWIIKKKFILVVDQMNSIEDDGKMHEEDKKLARSTIKDLFGYAQLTVYGFSANNQTMLRQQNTQRSERDIRLFGGFSEEEYDQWLNHHASFKPSVFQKKRIADVTGRVPMYLSQLFEHFKKKDCLNVQLALELYKDALAIECEEPLMKFYASTNDQHTDRIGSAKYLLRGEKPSLGPEFMDHRFFYILARSSHAVCGVAKECLAVILRTHLDVQADAYFLSKEFTQRCLKNGNPTVKGFEAEQIAISAINKHGFNICGIKHTIPIEDKVYFKSSNEAVLSDKACCHYIPKPFNYKHIDSLVRVQRFKQRSKTVESVDLYAMQYTLQSYTDHKGSLEFFNQDYQPWQGTAETIRWHFVWILTKAEAMRYKKETKPKVHGQVRTWTTSNGSKMNFREWFFSYGDVAAGLKDL